MILDLRSLFKATAALEDALRIYDASPLAEDAPEKIVLRDGTIQRFEFTFELAWKMLKRYLEHYGLERVDTLNNRDLFRMGFEHGLLGDPVRWFYYMRMRNQTSHVYNDAKAHEVFLVAREFLTAAQELATRMKEKMK